MIKIIKQYWKWKVGDKPTVTGGKASELVELGIAEWLDNTRHDSRIKMGEKTIPSKKKYNRNKIKTEE